MGLLDFKKPGWQHKDASVRLEAIRKLDPEQTEILLSVAQDDPEKQVRLAAIASLADIDSLENLRTDPDDEIRTTVIRRIDEMLYTMIIDSADPKECSEPLSKIQGTDITAKIAIEAEPASVRSAAIEKISDQDVLASIIKQKCGREPALLALEKIDDEKLLAELSEHASSKAARRMAGEKLSLIEAENFTPDPALIQEQQLSELLAATHNLVMAKDWDKAAERLVSLRSEWQTVDPTTTHHLSDEFAAACAAFEAEYRQICARREEEKEKASLIREKSDYLEDLCTTMESLVSSMDDNSDQRFNDALSNWENAAGETSFKIAITESLQNRFAKACESYKRGREKIADEKESFSIIEKKQLECEQLLSEGKTGRAQSALNETDKRMEQTKFKYLNAATLRRRQTELGDLLSEKLAETRQNNITARKNLCERLETLLESDKQAKSERKMKNIKQEWHDLPHAESEEEKSLEKRFADILEKFTEQQQTYFHDREWQGWASLTLKEKLLERVEGLDDEEDLATVQEQVKELQKEWKNAGPLPRNVSQKLWERFHAACDRNYQRCEPYREELKRLAKEAEKRRDEICLRAEELAESTEWNKTAEELKNLQAEWKNLLHGRRNEEEKHYRRFRKACNTFFDNRHGKFEEQEEKRKENLAEKEELCVEAEQLSAEPELASAEKFRELQNRWKKIGHVPRKKEDAIWKRFRAACDHFFNWLDEQRLENLKQKEALCTNAEEILASITEETDRKEISAQLTGLQEQWKEIGPVPNDRKDAVWERFHNACDEFFKAQREHFKEIEAKRLLVQEQKEDLLLQAEEVGSRGIDNETTSLMKELQKKWHEAGRASRDVEKDLNLRFKDICDSFFEGRRQHFNSLEEERLENLKNRESLCLRLENLLGTASESVNKGRDKALSLAEELKLAMEENFIMAGRRNDRKAVTDEVKKIQQEWKKVGPVPREHDKSTRQRFRKALDTFFNENTKSK